MSLHPKPSQSIPEQTMRVARASFPEGSLCVDIRDELGPIFTDEQFTSLYPNVGQSAFSPAKLGLITIFQFLEGMTDRQTAHAVRARIDWKYALGLELDFSGFDYSILSKYRKRLQEGGEESILFQELSNTLQEKGLLRRGGKQRTDSTHILASVRELNWLECTGQTMYAALNQLATVVPDWLQQHIPAEWFQRYGRPAVIMTYRS